MQMLILALIPLISSLECERYFCEDDFHPVPASACAIITKSESHTNNYFRSKRCGSDKVCSLSSSNPSVWECIDKKTSPLTPGDKCKEKHDVCHYGLATCNSTTHVCDGFTENQKCSTNLDCNPGLYCSNSICVPQLKKHDKGCSSDYDCINGYGCYKMANATDNFCVRYFILPEYHPINVTNTLGDFSFFCQYGYVFTNTTGTYCTNPVTSKHPLLNPNRCNSKDDCLSKEPYDFISDCTCGYNEVGHAYCDLFLGDREGLKLLELATEWFTSETNQMHCNTAKRFGEQCMRDWMSKEDYNNLIYRYFTYTYYPKFVGIQECVRMNLYPDVPF